MKGKSVEDFATTRYNIILSQIKKDQKAKKEASATAAMGTEAAPAPRAPGSNVGY
tara:strand:- start:7058 stop:7222 length:165 start_codon:yes stop_codon:yes gene_type:complete